MRRTTALLIAITAGALLLIGSAERADAQGTTVYDYDNTEAWWNETTCDEKQTLLPPYIGEANDDHEDRVCQDYDELEFEDRIIVRDFIIATEEKQHEDHEEWWDANGVDGNEYVRQQLVGALALVASTTPTSYTGGAKRTAEASGPATIFNDDYDDLGSSAKGRVDELGTALSGRGPSMTTDDEEAPALPFLATLMLGGLLAYCGAWLRRRNAATA